MRALTTSLGLFTIFPMPVRDIDQRAANGAKLALPVVGLILGALAGGLAALVSLRVSGLVPAAVALTVLAVCTGFLHLDGLADTADGLGSRRPPEEALAIMRQSDIGPMGVVAIVLVLLLEVAALSALGGGWLLFWAVLGGAMMSRVVMVVAMGTWLPSARKSGFGALFAASTSPAVATTVAVLGLAALVLPGVVLAWPHLSAWLVLAFVGAGFASLVVTHFGAQLFVKRFTGLTGDTFGALSELAIVTFWITLVCLL